MGTSGNEYSVSIPPNAVNVKIKARDTTNTIKVYTVSVGNGGSPANYVTIPANMIVDLRGMFGAQILYLMPSANTMVAEIFYIANNQ